MPLYPEDYAIIVGVNDYGPGIQRLRGCINDADLFYEWLIDPNGGGLVIESPNGYPPKIVRLKSPDPPPGFHPWPPSRNEYEDAILLLRRWASTQPNRRVGRRLYLWFSGHGASVRDDRNECAALMADAKGDALSRSIPGRRAAENFRGVAMFDEVVLFMDCCRSVVADYADAVLSWPDAPAPSVGQNVRCLYGFAASWAAPSIEKMLPHPFDRNKPPSVQGVFAHAVLEGLTLAIDSQGNVTSDTVANYVRARTVTLLADANNNLFPEMVPLGAPIYFRSGVPSEVQVKLSDPAGGLEVRSGEQFKLVNVAPVPHEDGGFRVLLSPGQYLFRAPAQAPFLRTELVTVIGGGPNVVNL